jgi:YD repeat-containing protein
VGVRPATGYDGEDRRNLFQDKAGREWRYTFDDRGNLLREEGPLGWSRAWEYNELDKRTLARDALGRETRYEYDARGNLTATRDALGFETAIDRSCFTPATASLRRQHRNPDVRSDRG